MNGIDKMADILLVAFNARFAHTAFGARYLLANLDDLQPRADLLEFDLQIQPRTAVEHILAHHPLIVAIGCYIWNIDLTSRVAALLKALRPDIRLILGGPEISYETEQQEIYQQADYIICGEGETAFKHLCHQLLNPPDSVPRASCGPRIIYADPVDLTQLTLPYALYTDSDIAHRAIYVEASRGCPFRCEYCMSSLDLSVRYFPEPPLFAAFEALLQRGARNFKFVDRTFNIDIPFACRLLQFFIDRYQPGLMLHFEVIPDRLPDDLLALIQQCPPGMLQFEIGIQTLNEEVAHRIQRPLNMAKIEANIRRLAQETHVHIHADLIAGLPGENRASFEAGFNQLLTLRPQEIQLGILKRLRGAPIDRHTRDWNMVYSPHAPYEVLQTSSLSFDELQRISRFARFWNLTVNNGQFIHTAPLIWQNASSPFAAFMNWSDWLYAQTNTTGNIALLRLAQLLLRYLTEQGLPERTAAEALWKDYQRGNRPDIPGFLKKFGFELPKKPEEEALKTAGERQTRHLSS
jgi:radical SAM superfamily enzyme YgiQ (UPF0313 family)